MNMSFGKITSWFISDAGKKVSFFTAGTVCCGVVIGTFLPHTIFLEQYKDFIRLYE